MSDIISTIIKLPGMESHKPASEEVIKSVEEKLNLKFADDYREYLINFGAVRSEIIAISGITNDPEYGVLELTNKIRLFNTQIPTNFYVIEDVGVDGLVIWQDETGTIYQSLPTKAPMQLYNNLTDYLEYVIKG